MRVPSRRLTVERSTKYGRHYVVRDGADALIAHLSFREVRALEAVDAGRVRWRMHRTYTPWLCDAYLAPDVDDYGVGAGTVTGLCGSWSPPLVVRATREGPARLTPLGRRVLRLILDLPGVTAAARAS